VLRTDDGHPRRGGPERLQLETPRILEIFCGCARLTASFIKQGVKALGIDHAQNRHRTEGPCLNLDLTKPPEQDKLLNLIAEGSDVCMVWLAIPCGTFSRARERPLPRHLRQQGVPNPQPLRSESEP